MLLLPYSMFMHTLAAVIVLAVRVHPSWLLLSDSRVKERQVTVPMKRNGEGEIPSDQALCCPRRAAHTSAATQRAPGAQVRPPERGPWTSRPVELYSGAVPPPDRLGTWGVRVGETLSSSLPARFTRESGEARVGHSDARRPDGSRHVPWDGPLHHRHQQWVNNSKSGHLSVDLWVRIDSYPDTDAGTTGEQWKGGAVWVGGLRPHARRNEAARDACTPTLNSITLYPLRGSLPFPQGQSDHRQLPTLPARHIYMRGVSRRPVGSVGRCSCESVGGPRGPPLV